VRNDADEVEDGGVEDEDHDHLARRGADGGQRGVVSSGDA
jgi:hypothetical protein